MSGTRQVKVEILSQAQTGGFTATDSAAEHTEGVLGRVTGGIGRVGSAFGGLAKMAGGFVLAEGILSAPGKLLAMAQAAADDSASIGRLQVAVQNTGVSWDDYKGQLDGVVAGGQKLGFSDDETRDGLVTLANETGNTDEAMRRMSSAYDLARGTGMDLHTASKLLGKVTDENRNVFKKYGIDIGDAATAQDVLNVVDQKFQGQAGKYAESDAGKVARLKDAWGELQEQLGYKMLPVLSAVTSFMLDKVLPGASVLADKLDGPLHDGFEAVRDAGERIVGLFQGPLGSAFDAVRGHFDLIKRVIGDLLTVARGPLGNAIQGMIQGFGQDGLAGILPGAIEGLRHFGDALRDLGGLALDALGTVDWAGLGQTILSGIGTALGAVSSLATSIDWGAIASQMWTLLGDALSAAESITVDLASAFISLVTGTDWSSVAGAVASSIGTAWGALADAGGYILSWVTAGIGGIQWGDLPGQIATGLGTAWGALTDAGTYIYNWISGSLGSIAWGDIPGQIASGIGTAWGALTDAGTYVYTWITTGLASIPWADIGSAISTGVGTAWSLLTDAGTWVYTWISTGLASVDWPGLASQITAGLSGALSAAQGAGDTGGGLLSGILGTIDLTPITDQFTALMTAIQPVTDAISGTFVAAWDALNAAFTGATTNLTALDPLFAQLSVLWTNLQTLGAALVPALQMMATVVGAALVVSFQALTVVLQTLTPILGPIFNAAVQLTIGSITTLVATLNIIVTTVSGVVKIISDLIHGDWSKAWADAKQMAADFVTGVQGIFSGLPAVMGGIFASMATAVLTAVQGMSTSALTALQGLATSGLTALQGMATSIEGAVSGMVGSVQGFISDMAGTVTGQIIGMVGSVEGAIGGMAGSVGGFFSDMWHTASDAAVSMYNDVTSSVSNLVTTVVAYVSALPGQAAGAVGDLSDTLFQAGVDLVQGFVNGILSMAGAVIDAASSVAHNAIDTITSFGRSPWPAMIESGRDAIMGFTLGMSEEQQNAVKAAADVAKSVIDTFTALMDFGDRLSKGFTLPAVAQIAQFNQSVADLITSFAATADTFRQHALNAAKNFADSAKTVVDFVKAGADALTALVDFVRPSDQAIADFKFAVEKLVQSIADSGQLLTVDAAASAKLFAEAAKPIVEMVKSGIEAFAALASDDQDFSVEDTAYRFAKKVELLVQAVRDSALTFISDGLKAATDFATAAKPIIDLVQGGLAAFAALATTDQNFSVEDIAYQFAKKVELLVQAIRDSALAFTADGLAATQAFVDAAKPIVDLVGGALTAFTALAGADLTANVDANLAAFGSFVKAAVKKVVTIASQFKADGLAAAKQFSDAGKSVFDLIGGAITAFTALGSPDFIQPSMGRVDAFEKFIVQVVQKLVDASAAFTADGLTAAKQFADTGKAIFEMLASATAFDGLPDFGKHFADQMAGFLDNVKLAVKLIDELVTELGDGLDKAVEAAAKIAKIVGLLTGGAGVSNGGGGGGSTGTGAGGGGAGSGGGYTGSGSPKYPIAPGAYQGKYGLPSQAEVDAQWGPAYKPTGTPMGTAPAQTARDAGQPVTVQLYLSPDHQTPLASWALDTISDLLQAGATLRPSTVGNGL